MIVRRGILKCLAGLVATPAIIKVADLMPVKSMLTDRVFTFDDYNRRLNEFTISQFNREAWQSFKNSNPFPQERKEDEQTPRRSSSPATQRTNPETVA